MSPGAWLTSVQSFMATVQIFKKLFSLSWERWNFRRRLILCTTLYRNPIQASKFGGTFDQLFFWKFLCNVHTRCPSTFSIPWCKKVKFDQNLKINQGVLPFKGKSFRVWRNWLWLQANKQRKSSGHDKKEMTKKLTKKTEGTDSRQCTHHTIQQVILFQNFRSIEHSSRTPSATHQPTPI